MSFENSYSFSDRLLHRVAFSTPQLQVVLSDIEDNLFKKSFSDLSIEEPVFITAIPRAGTTLLLELLVQGNEFTSHCYRDMPFVLIPLIWDKFSKSFRKNDQPRERAHGDGIKINVDSPEAFEEIIWKAFWKKQYKDEYISPWDVENNEEFNNFIHNHFKKIISLRSQGETGNLRYLSKNNLNIARVSLLQKLFPTAKIVLPFRDPVQHAASLLKQHLNFTEIHKQDPFAKDYMAAIGHFDFGDNLKPIDFNNWFSSGNKASSDTLEFWLQYWLASYQFLQKQCNDKVKLFNYEAFCAEPDSGLDVLGKFLNLKNKENLLQQASRVRSPKPHTIDKQSVPSGLVAEARDLFTQLAGDSLNQ